MTFIETIASHLSNFRIPVGRLNPYTLVAEVCSSFIQADELQQHGIEIEGRKMSTKEFQAAVLEYIGIDLVPEILETEVRDGINIHDHAIILILHSLENAAEYPDSYNRNIREITSDILQAQSRLSS